MEKNWKDKISIPDGRWDILARGKNY